jgi:hypothetical protein
MTNPTSDKYGAEFSSWLDAEFYGIALSDDEVNLLKGAYMAGRIALSAERALKVHEHDCPTAWNFFNKHGLGDKLCPSCLLCGKVEGDRDRWSIQHMELPNIYICKGCVDAARRTESAIRDTERLNWLEKRAEGFANIDRITSVSGTFNTLPTLREAIDELERRNG